MKDYGECHNFIGINNQRNLKDGTISIDQTAYLSKVLKKFSMDNCKPISTPMEFNLKLNEQDNKVTQSPYRELVGSLMYAAIATRPDNCYAINYFSRFQVNQPNYTGSTLKEY